MRVRDFDPRVGQAFQGDIAIIALPATIAVAKIDEVAPIDGRLIIQEGEASGHHHAITLPRQRAFRDDTRQLGDPSVTMTPRLRSALGGGTKAKATARLYRDTAAIEALRQAGIITRTDLAIGCLVVEGAPMVVQHEEHDGIRVPAGQPIRIIEVSNGSLEPDGARRKFHLGAMPGKSPHEVVAASYGINPAVYREAVRT